MRRRPHRTSQVYVKDLRATTDRDSLLDMFDRAREVGFNVDRLQITNMHLHIRASVASTGRVPAGGLNGPVASMSGNPVPQTGHPLPPLYPASMVSSIEF